MQPDRLGIPEPGRRDIGRTPVVRHRPLAPPAPGVLFGQLGRDRVGVVGVEQLEALGDTPVQQPAFRRADLGVGRFAEHVMGEVVAVPELLHDPAPPQFVDGLDDDVGLQVARLGEQAKGEVRSHRRRETGYLPGRRGRLLETLAQHGLKVADRQRRAAGIGGAAYGLDDVQREASRGRVQQVRVGRQEGLPGNRLGQMRGVGRVQRAERELGEQPAGPHADGPLLEFRILAEVVVAQGPGHEERCAAGQAQAEGDEGQRLLVTPLHVVQDKQHRAADGEQRPRQAFEKAVALPGICHNPRPGLASATALGRYQPADFSAPGGVDGRRR